MQERVTQSITEMIVKPALMIAGAPLAPEEPWALGSERCALAAHCQGWRGTAKERWASRDPSTSCNRHPLSMAHLSRTTGELEREPRAEEMACDVGLQEGNCQAGCLRCNGHPACVGSPLLNNFKRSALVKACQKLASLILDALTTCSAVHDQGWVRGSHRAG